MPVFSQTINNLHKFQSFSLHTLKNCRFGSVFRKHSDNLFIDRVNPKKIKHDVMSGVLSGVECVVCGLNGVGGAAAWWLSGAERAFAG
jgi:hypothetical protein